MLTRREFLEKAVGAAAVSLAGPSLVLAERPAWSGPIGLELYTVRDLFAKDPAGTLKKIAAAGYREVEIGPGSSPQNLKGELHAAGLTAPSGYFDTPKTIEDWKKTMDQAHAYGLQYLVVGDNPKLGAEAWKRRAELFNECGKLAQQAGMQFCYHAHYREFAHTDGASGYDIMLKHCDPKLLKMEMDVFWATYAGQDPLQYFQKYPGRFPLLHIKDFKPGFPTSTSDFPYDNGPNPFAPAGQGRIDWKAIFAHGGQAGTQHIFVEQDRCDVSPLESIKISYEYLRNLQLS
jgi:sugar phosphate isomerase/epimerase